MATNKKKTTTAIVAGVTAAVLLLGGTFAWTSISQRALNEAAGVVNVGGRLHDDFNGKNKDVYVENFTDPLNGGQPIYARVKLTEYMEVGKEAGKLNEEGTAFDPNRNAKSVIDGADIDKVDSWSVHKPVDNCAECKENGELCKFHEHWEWKMGGQTTYMPTFNKDKDSLKADINGTYAGTNPNDKVYYDDYVVYTTEETGAKDVPFADKEKTEVSIYSVTGTEYYDADTDTDENTTEGQYRIEENVTHTAKQTGTATVMTMEEWLQNPVAGNFWVYDTDGWAYWANPIMPGEATGLLLDGIDMTKNPGEKCYYSINVVGQFATVNDWELFGVDKDDPDYPSDDALKVLSTAANNVTVVTVNNESGISTIKCGDTANFSATVSTGGEKVENPTLEWAVYDAELKPIDAESGTKIEVANGVATLTVGAKEQNQNLIIAATHTETGAVGLSSVAIKDPDVILSIKVNADETYMFTPGKTFTIPETTVTGDDIGEGKLTWSVKDSKGSILDTYSVEETNGTYTLTIPKNATERAVDVVATYTLPNGYSVSDSLTVYNSEIVTTNEMTADAYAVLTSDKTLLFLRSEDSIVSGKSTYEGNTITAVHKDIESHENFNAWPWKNDGLVAVNFLNKIKLKTGTTLFYNIETLKSVTGFENLSIEDDRMDFMFANTGIEKFEVSNLDLTGITFAQGMFSRCKSLKTVVVDNWTTPDLNTTEAMFSECTALETVSMNGWDTSKVTDMSSMFYNCENLTLDCSSWNVNSVTKYTYFCINAEGVIEPKWVS